MSPRWIERGDGRLSTPALSPNQYGQKRYSEGGGFGPFEVGPGELPSMVYDMRATRGCTCAQIVEAAPACQGHLKKGCSPSLMEERTGVGAAPDRDYNKGGKGR
ncbi:MAG: hypothetical protein ABII00_08640 [Elusimicrobiota bacterium]